jgi:hypothetical protein
MMGMNDSMICMIPRDESVNDPPDGELAKEQLR